MVDLGRLRKRGGWLVGVALDAAGGVSQPHAWTLAFAAMSAAAAMGPLCLWWSRPKRV